MNFFDWFAVAIWAGVILSTVRLLRGLRRSQPSTLGPAPRLHDLSEAAFMAGGPGSVVDAALVSLLCDGRMVVGGPGIVQVRPGVRAADPAERAVLQAQRGAPSGWLYQIRYAAMRDPAVQEIGDALAARGLIAPPRGRRAGHRHGVIQAVACGVLLMLSLPLTFIALTLALRDEDGSFHLPFIVEVFPVLLAGIVMGIAGTSRTRQRVTRAGAAALRDIRAHYRTDRSPYVQVSLFGLRGLRDPYLREQLVPAARGTRLAAAQAGARTRGSGQVGTETVWATGADAIPVVWCAGGDGGSGGSGGSSCGSGASCGSSGSGCSSGSSCGSSGSSCGSSSSSCSSGSSCSSSSGSSCSSSS
ncbi:TIGR04222 domain-containing membrane protein [Streptomyces sp. NPDC006544]|uniref:TIGR04222 domain-containing membrane protein n=1 Tax=Streptomyces sp. NPDC006544 TaxID=3154583 RepID=UPI0033ADBECE